MTMILVPEIQPKKRSKELGKFHREDSFPMGDNDRNYKMINKKKNGVQCAVCSVRL